MAATLKIAEVARRSGFNASTLRYYEDVGLVPPVARTPAGYRVYDEGSLARLAFIARAKQLGCSLEEITDLVTAWEGDRCEPVQQQLQDLVEAKIVAARDRIGELQALTEQLQQAADALQVHTPDGPCDDDCGCAVPDPSVDVPSGPTVVALTTKPVPLSEPPIACTLTNTEMATRVEDWQALLGSATGREPLDGGVRVVFGSDASLAALAALVAAEQACCMFLRFALTVDARGVALEVTAPGDALGIIHDLFGSPS